MRTMCLKRSKWLCLALLLTAVLAVDSAKAINVYLSPAGSVGGGATAGNPTPSHGTGENASLFVWIDLDGVDLGGAALNVVSSNTGVIQFTGAETFNPKITISSIPAFDRWNSVGAGATTNDAVTGFNGFRILGADGLLSTNTTAARLDTLYDAAPNAFLFARIDYQTLALGSTDLFLQIGSQRISPITGVSSDVPVFFGAGEAQSLTGDQSGVSSSFADATVTVVPEPTVTSMLLIVGAVLTCGSRQFRLAPSLHEVKH